MQWAHRLDADSDLPNDLLRMMVGLSRGRLSACGDNRGATGVLKGLAWNPVGDIPNTRSS